MNLFRTKKTESAMAEEFKASLRKRFAHVALHPPAEWLLRTKIYQTNDGQTLEQACASYQRNTGWRISRIITPGKESILSDYKTPYSYLTTDFLTVIEELAKFEQSQATLGRTEAPHPAPEMPNNSHYFRDFAREEGLAFDALGMPHPVLENGMPGTDGTFNPDELSAAGEASKKRTFLFDPIPLSLLPGNEGRNTQTMIILGALKQIRTTFERNKKFVAEFSPQYWLSDVGHWSSDLVTAVNYLDNLEKKSEKEMLSSLKIVEQNGGNHLINEIRKAHHLFFFYANLIPVQDGVNPDRMTERIDAAKRCLKMAGITREDGWKDLKIPHTPAANRHAELDQIIVWIKDVSRALEESHLNGGNETALKLPANISERREP